MNSRDRYIKEKLILYGFKLFIIALFCGIMYGAWVEYYNPLAPTPFYRLGNYFLGALIVTIYVYFVKVYGGFMVGTATVPDLIFSQIISIGFLQGACYVIFSLLSYRLVSVWPFIILFVLFSAVAVGWCYLIDHLYYKMHKPRKSVVVFGNDDSYLSLYGISDMKKRYTVVATYDSRKTSLEELLTKLDGVSGVFLCGVPSEYRNEVVKYCIANEKIAYVKPKISDTIIRGGRTIQLMNVPVYRCKRANATLAYLVVKRAMDIILSLIAIVLASPFMIGTAIAIKLQDGGPVFYRQTRLTTNRKEFKVIKFRSMILDAEKSTGAVLAKEGDDRITPLGHFIRKVRFDELPQLFNILKGDMSFVGPRPERPEIAKQYEAEMPEFALRLQVKAGLTGYAQIYGKYNTPPYDKVQMDLMYIANQSIFEDLRLMLMTFKILFISSSTEGIDADQKTAQRATNQIDK